MSFLAMREKHDKFENGGDNLGLCLERLNKSIDDPTRHEHESKDAFLRNLSSFRISESLRNSYKYAYQNWLEIQSKRKNTLCFFIQSTTKVLLGTGNASVHEFGFNLNKPWGVPYISGSTIKGLVSSYLYRHGGEEWWRDRNSSKKSECQVELLGGTLSTEKEEEAKSYIGSVIFNDAWLLPSEDKWFVEDIINAHNPKYYSGNRLPDGTENPNPVKIAALKPGLKFLVVLEGSDNALQFIQSVLAKALVEEGLGGKTAVGYGRFEIQESSIDRFWIKRIASEIEIETNPEKLKELYKEHKKDDSLYNAFQKSLEGFKEYEPKLESLYIHYSPLRVLTHRIRVGEIKSVAELSNNKLKKQFPNLIDELNKKKPLKEAKEGQILFKLILEKLKPTESEIQEHWLLKELKYTWFDSSPDSDEVMEIIGNEDHIWPPISELEEYILKSNTIKEDKDTLISLLKEEY